MDTKDYNGKKPEKIAWVIRENVQDGDIILVHDTGDYEHEAIQIYDTWLSEHGYLMVTPDEPAQAWGVTPQSGVVYRSFRPSENTPERCSSGSIKSPH